MVSKAKAVLAVLIIFFIAAFILAPGLQVKSSGALLDKYHRELPDRPTSNESPDSAGWLAPLDRGGYLFGNHINASGLFQPYVVYPAGTWASAVGVGDFNHDGLNDVAITDSNYSNSKLRIFLQNASGTLDTPVVYNTGSRPESLSVGDLNNDQLDDVVVANFTSNTIGVFLQQVDGTLAPQVTYTASSGPDAVAVADLNNDGLDDVVVSHWSAANIGVFLQQPDGTLGPRISYPSPQAGYDDIDTGDLNNDGLMDVVKMNGQLYANPNLSVYLQTVSGNLSGPTSYDLGDILSHGVAAGDLTGDGLVDLALVHGGNRPTSKLSVFEQTVSGALQLGATYNAYDIPEPVEIADVDMDGRLDVLVAHGGWERLGIFLQQTNGTLAPYLLDNIPYATHYKPQGMDVGDINNDGLPDVVIADYNYGLVVLYHIYTTATATPTSTSTVTETPDPASTPTPTYTPTETETPLPTIYTSTVTPITTSTATRTLRPTKTSMPSPTATSTPTPTSTVTLTSTPTWTVTPMPTFTFTPTPTNIPGCVFPQGSVIYGNDFESGADVNSGRRSH